MKKNWVRVVESLIVAVASATSAFVLIYFYNDCKSIGTANITRPLQVVPFVNLGFCTFYLLIYLFDKIHCSMEDYNLHVL